jgi:hypothetical protein
MYNYGSNTHTLKGYPSNPLKDDFVLFYFILFSLFYFLFILSYFISFYFIFYIYMGEVFIWLIPRWRTYQLAPARSLEDLDGPARHDGAGKREVGHIRAPEGAVHREEPQP